MDAISFTQLSWVVSAASDVGLHDWLLTFLRASGLIVIALLLVRALRRLVASFTVGRRAHAWPHAAKLAATRRAWAHAKRAAQAPTGPWHAALCDRARLSLFLRGQIVPA